MLEGIAGLVLALCVIQTVITLTWLEHNLMPELPDEWDDD
jgi:hypothetical protein